MISLVIEYERSLKKDIFVGGRFCARSGCCYFVNVLIHMALLVNIKEYKPKAKVLDTLQRQYLT